MGAQDVLDADHGAGWCPRPACWASASAAPAEKAAVLAKEALMEHIDIQELIARGPQTTEEKLRVELYDKVNRLGIGAQGPRRLSPSQCWT